MFSILFSYQENFLDIAIKTLFHSLLFLVKRAPKSGPNTPIIVTGSVTIFRILAGMGINPSPARTKGLQIIQDQRKVNPKYLNRLRSTSFIAQPPI